MTWYLVLAFPYKANGLGGPLEALTIYKNTRTGVDGAVGGAPGLIRMQGD